MSRDRRHNREYEDDRKAARKAAKHADKKRDRFSFKHHIKDVIGSDDLEELDEMYNDEEERH